MPVIKELHFNFETQLILWKIDESEQELLQLVELPEAEKEKLNQRKSSQHRIEFLSSRASLSALGISINNLQFHEHGAPFLANQKFCSLSHSAAYAAAVISDKSVGVDVEAYRDKIVHIASKFRHQNEEFTLNKENEVVLLTRLWTAKEAIYKAFGMPGIHFSKQILVAPFSIEDENGSARLVHLDKEYSFSLHFRSIINGELCVAIKNN